MKKGAPPVKMKRHFFRISPLRLAANRLDASHNRRLRAWRLLRFMTQQIPLVHHRYAIIDDCDFERVSQFTWTCSPDNYVFHALHTRQDDGSYRQGRIWLHRFILDAPQSKLVDHKNRNRFDNRRFNLREANRSQNAANSPPRAGTSKFKGVSWVKSRGIWKASIGVNYRYSTVGQFENEMDAALAYDRAAFAAWGEFAYLNFPELVR